MTEPTSLPRDSTAASLEGPESAERLQRLWAQGTRVDLEAFLQAAGPLKTEDLAAVLHVDQHERWQRGERTDAEGYLQRFPDVCVDAESVVDIIFHEYLLREGLGERPGSTEYAERFPDYAEALQSQIAFHRLLKDSSAPVLESQSAASTVSIPAHSLPPAGQIGLAPRGGLSSDREVQALLRRRLRILSLVVCVAFLSYIPVMWTVLPGWGTFLYVVVLAQTALVVGLLWTRRALSLSVLRWIEASLVGTQLLWLAWEQSQFFQASLLSALAGSGWIGPAMAARCNNVNWALVVIVYGAWIPNTTRRAIVAITTMLVVFLAVTLGLALTAPSASPGTVLEFMVYSTMHMCVVAVIAMLGAYRIQTLQRAVTEARKLGPYRLIKRLSAGGMGEVYVAEHVLLRRPCALKRIRAEWGGDERSLSRFEREVQTMATLTHPNTVRIYDYGRAEDGTFYYTMEFLPGMSLQELVTKHGPLPPGRAVYFLRQVCGALREAHNVGLVHRDIKPANILACELGGTHDIAKLLDFGLVRVNGLSTDGNSLTGVGTIAGTPAFMSPEQAAGTDEIDERSDIYSLGAVTYFLLTGRPPFAHATSVETMAAHLSQAVEPLHRVRPETPADLERVVLRCLSKKPEERFADVTAVEEALAGCTCRDAWSSEQAAEWWRSEHTR